MPYVGTGRIKRVYRGSNVIYGGAPGAAPPPQTEILSPWTALSYAAPTATTSYGNGYNLSAGPIGQQYTAAGVGNVLLSAPVIRLTKAGDSDVTLTAANTVVTSDEGKFTWSGAQDVVFSTAGIDFTISWDSWLEYDGLLWTTLTFEKKTSNIAFDTMVLELRVINDRSPIVACPFWDSSRGVDATDQTLEIPDYVAPGNPAPVELKMTKGYFLSNDPSRGSEQQPVVWLKDENGRGVCWMSEGMRNWTSIGEANKPIKITRESDHTLVEIKFATTGVNLSTPATWPISFGMVVTPCRADEGNFRFDNEANVDNYESFYNYSAPSPATLRHYTLTGQSVAPWHLSWDDTDQTLHRKSGLIRATHAQMAGNAATNGGYAQHAARADKNFRTVPYCSLTTYPYESDQGSFQANRDEWRVLKENTREVIRSGVVNAIDVCAYSTGWQAHWKSLVDDYVARVVAGEYNTVSANPRFNGIYADVFAQHCTNQAHWDQGSTDVHGDQYQHYPILAMRDLTKYTYKKLYTNGQVFMHDPSSIQNPAYTNFGHFAVTMERLNTFFFKESLWSPTESSSGGSVTSGNGTPSAAENDNSRYVQLDSSPILQVWKRETGAWSLVSPARYAKTYADVPARFWQCWKRSGATPIVVPQHGRASAAYLERGNYDRVKELFDALQTYGLNHVNTEVSDSPGNAFWGLAKWQRDQENQQTNMQNNLAEWWPMNEASATANALGFLAIDATVNGSCAATTGYPSGGARTISSGNYFRVLKANMGALDIGASESDFTVACRVKFNSVSGTQVIVSHSSGGTDGWLLRWEGTGEWWRMLIRHGQIGTPATYDGTQTSPATAGVGVTTGVWYSIVAYRVKSTAVTTIMWRGEDGTGSLHNRTGSAGNQGKPVHSSSDDFTIGATGAGGNALLGDIDDVCMWPRIISPGEVLAFLEGQKPD